MNEESFDRALASLRAGKRWSQGGADYRQGEYDCGREEVWFDGEGFVHRSYGAHGWGGDLPSDVNESIERWDEVKLRDRLGSAFNNYDWENAPSGAPSTPAAFDPTLPVPGSVACDKAVTHEDVERVVGHLRRGYSFEQTGAQTRGGHAVWGKERIWHPPSSEIFVHTRSWALGAGDDVRVLSVVWDEAQLREFLRTRADVVHAERWPKG